jgi:hypothetical protein
LTEEEEGEDPIEARLATALSSAVTPRICASSWILALTSSRTTEGSYVTSELAAVVVVVVVFVFGR